MIFPAPLGISDFRAIRERGLAYVDKSAFISEVLTRPGQVKLFPRPRRFGKTLNLSMLRAFIDSGGDDSAELFEGLEVWEDAEARAHFRRYPTVSLTFKDVRHADWPGTLESVGILMSEAFRAHAAILDHLDEADSEVFQSVLELRASETTLAGGVRWLCGRLHRHYEEKVFVLIDEYDAPIHAGYAHGYFDDSVRFFRNLLSGVFKDNDDLAYGVSTGILRLAKESIFSGLNNLAVYSVLHQDFGRFFGFTEAEVARLAHEADADEHLDEMRRWYDGYRIGGTSIYNPWSVLSFLGRSDRRPATYWANTSSNALVRDLLVRCGLADLSEVEALLEGELVPRQIEEHLSLRDLDQNPDALWSLLLYSGYLTAESASMADELEVSLRVPNREVQTLLRGLFASTMRDRAGGGSAVLSLTRALLSGDVEDFEGHLGEILRDTLSSFDLGGRKPERVYHAFVAGLLVHLGPDHRVRSNRESGYGRVDVCVTPTRPGLSGAVLELKVLREGQQLDGALDAALAQIVDRGYAAELRAHGASPIHEYAVVFDGKHAHTRLRTV